MCTSERIEAAKLKLARRKGNYEDRHSAKVTERLILISHLRNVMLRDMLSRIKEKAEELVSGVQAEFRLNEAPSITLSTSQS